MIIDQTQRVPLFRLRGSDEIEHRVQFFQTENVLAQFEDIDVWPLVGGSSDSNPSDLNKRHLATRRVPSSLWSALETDTTWPKVRVQKQAPVRGHLLARVVRESSSWWLHIQGDLDSGQQRENVLLELPSAFFQSEAFKSQTPNSISTLMPSTVNRQVIVVPVRDGHFEWKSEMPPEANQLLQVPDIRMLDGDEIEQYLALPEETNGIVLGVDPAYATPLDDESERSKAWRTSLPSNSRLYRRTQVQLPIRIPLTNPTIAKVECPGAFYELQIDSQWRWQVRCRFWFDPVVPVALQMEIPEQWNLIHSEVHGKPILVEVDQRVLRLTTHPTDVSFLVELWFQGDSHSLPTLAQGTLPKWNDVVPAKRWMRLSTSRNLPELRFSDESMMVEEHVWWQSLWQASFPSLSKSAGTVALRDAPARMGWYVPWRHHLDEIVKTLAFLDIEPSSGKGATSGDPLSSNDTSEKSPTLPNWMDMSDLLRSTDVRLRWQESSSSRATGEHAAGLNWNHHWCATGEDDPVTFEFASTSNWLNRYGNQSVATGILALLVAIALPLRGQFLAFSSFVRQRPWWLLTVASLGMMALYPQAFLVLFWEFWQLSVRSTIM